MSPLVNGAVNVYGNEGEKLDGFQHYVQHLCPMQQWQEPSKLSTPNLGGYHIAAQT